MNVANNNILKDPLMIRNQVLNWLESMREVNAQFGTYKMSLSTEATLFSSCFAIFVRHLFGDLDNISDSNKREWIELINSWQDNETGLFIDPRLKSRGLFSSHLTKSHDWGYVTWQSTTFCISALDALGGQMRYHLKFLNEWKNAEKVRTYLQNLDWRWRTWTNGNLAMFLGICLLTDYEKNNDLKSKEALTAFFDWHDGFSDPNTGFWGTNCGTPVHFGLFGAIHQYLLYYYTQRPLKYPEKIVDYTLLMQQADGLFSPIGGGGACEDLDAIDTLVNIFQHNDYKRNEIKIALNRALTSIIHSQNDDGGFPWAKRYGFGVRDWANLGQSTVRMKSFGYCLYSVAEAFTAHTLLRGKPLRPPGWTETPIPSCESYIFATWFRCLSIALISQIIPENPYAQMGWKFLAAPGLGYFSKVKPCQP